MLSLIANNGCGIAHFNECILQTIQDVFKFKQNLQRKELSCADVSDLTAAPDDAPAKCLFSPPMRIVIKHCSNED